MVDLVLLAIREWETHPTLVYGRGGDNKGLAHFVSRQKYGPGERSRAARIVKGLVGLYRDFNEGHVRGVLLEQLVEQQLRSRYAGTGCLCENNVKIELGPASSRHQTSRGLDVVGWDGRVGEGHDCKTDAVSWKSKQSWLDELSSDVAPRGLLVGLVTADSRSVAERKLRREGVQFRGLTLVHADRLYAALPMHK